MLFTALKTTSVFAALAVMSLGGLLPPGQCCCQLEQPTCEAPQAGCCQAAVTPREQGCCGAEAPTGDHTQQDSCPGPALCCHTSEAPLAVAPQRLEWSPEHQILSQAAVAGDSSPTAALAPFDRLVLRSDPPPVTHNGHQAKLGVWRN